MNTHIVISTSYTLGTYFIINILYHAEEMQIERCTAECNLE